MKNRVYLLLVVLLVCSHSVAADYERQIVTITHAPSGARIVLDDDTMWSWEPWMFQTECHMEDWTAGDGVEISRCGLEPYRLVNQRNKEKAFASLDPASSQHLPTLIAIKKAGERLLLSDGSAWATSRSHSRSSRTWKIGDRVIVVPRDSEGFVYHLYNDEVGASWTSSHFVHARRVTPQRSER